MMPIINIRVLYHSVFPAYLFSFLTKPHAARYVHCEILSSTYYELFSTEYYEKNLFIHNGLNICS